MVGMVGSSKITCVYVWCVYLCICVGGYQRLVRFVSTYLRMSKDSINRSRSAS